MEPVIPSAMSFIKPDIVVVEGGKIDSSCVGGGGEQDGGVMETKE